MLFKLEGNFISFLNILVVSVDVQYINKHDLNTHLEHFSFFHEHSLQLESNKLN